MKKFKFVIFMLLSCFCSKLFAVNEQNGGLIVIKALLPVEKGNEQYIAPQIAAFDHAVSQMKKDPKYSKVDFRIIIHNMDCSNFDKYLNYLSDNQINLILSSDSCGMLDSDYDKKMRELKILSFSFQSLSEVPFDNLNHQELFMFESSEKQEELMLAFLKENKWDNFLVVENFVAKHGQFKIDQKLRANGKIVHDVVGDFDEKKSLNEDLFSNLNEKVESMVWLLDATTFLRAEKILSKKNIYKKKILGGRALCTNYVASNIKGDNIYCLSAISYDEKYYKNDVNIVKILDAIKKKMSTKVTTLSSRVIRSYLVPFLIADAALKINSNNGPTIRKALIDNSWDSVIGKVGFSKKGYFDKSPSVIKHLNSQKTFDIVYPKEFVH